MIYICLSNWIELQKGEKNIFYSVKNIAKNYLFIGTSALADTSVCLYSLLRFEFAFVTFHLRVLLFYFFSSQLRETNNTMSRLFNAHLKSMKAIKSNCRQILLAIFFLSSIHRSRGAVHLNPCAFIARGQHCVSAFLHFFTYWKLQPIYFINKFPSKLFFMIH